MADSQAHGGADDRDVFDELLSILDRLNGLFGDATEKPQGPIVRRLDKDTVYCDETTDAQLWQHHLDIVRTWADDSTGVGPTAKEAFASAARLLQLIGNMPAEDRKRLPIAVTSDVGRIHTLVYSAMPQDCGCCGQPFVPDLPGAAWCHACRTGRGRLYEVDVALQCWWKWNQSIPQPLLDSTEFNDLREAFFDRFHVRLGYSGIVGQPAPQNAFDVSQQQQKWDEFWLLLRKFKRPSNNEHEWHDEMLGKSIGEVTALLGGGIGLIGKMLSGHPGAVAQFESQIPEWMKPPDALPSAPPTAANLDFIRGIPPLAPWGGSDDAKPGGEAKPADDLLTIAQLAKLARVSESRFSTALSDSRKPGSTSIPPQPIAENKRHYYSYRQIRPWLLSTWWKCEAFFPESFNEVKNFLAGDIPTQMSSAG